MSQGPSPRVVALVPDLMDRSRITAVAADTSSARVPHEVGGADVVVVDLARYAESLGEVRAHAPEAFVVAFGRHDDTPRLEAARAAGADRVLTRARFFADVASALDRNAAGSEEPSDR